MVSGELSNIRQHSAYVAFSLTKLNVREGRAHPFSRLNSVAITMALPASEQSSLYSESNIAKAPLGCPLSTVSLIGFEPHELHPQQNLLLAHTRLPSTMERQN